MLIVLCYRMLWDDGGGLHCTKGTPRQMNGGSYITFSAYFTKNNENTYKGGGLSPPHVLNSILCYEVYTV